LLPDVTIGTGPQRTPFASCTSIGYLAWRDVFHCCVTLLCHNLVTDISSN
jgi:hypothetical protein